MGIEWTESMATGIAEVDEQHKSLFGQVGELLDAMRAGKGVQQVEPMLAFLARYVVMHFDTEERLMTAHGYPGLEGHRGQHAAFVLELGKLKEKFDHEGPTRGLAFLLNVEVGGWLVNHVLGSDQAIGAFLRGRLRT